MAMKVRTRIAPSPTGYVHVGNTYTAYLNYIFAKKNNGVFILRLDDTDAKRHVEDAEQYLYDLWRWLGIKWTEGPDIGGPHKNYRQSERLDRYHELADQLVKSGKAYHHEGAVFLRVDSTGSVIFNDLIRKQVTFDKSEINDQVLIKSDRYPTYMFATVVDDIDFEISHVIRAEDHLSNTPKQILIYQALESSPPIFAHLPLLRNPDKSKLSKRQQHTSLAWYKELGFLPESLKNYFALLGWTHPEEKEIFNELEFTQLFTFEQMNTTAPVFDIQKLTWLNGSYIRNLPIHELQTQLIKYLDAYNPDISNQMVSDRAYFANVLKISQERLKTLSEFWDQNRYFFEQPNVTDTPVLAFFNTPNELHTYLNALLELLHSHKLTWKAENLHNQIDALRENLNLKPKEAYMSLRFILSGQSTTPPIFDTLEVLGKTETLKRIEWYLNNTK